MEGDVLGYIHGGGGGEGGEAWGGVDLEEAGAAVGIEKVDSCDLEAKEFRGMDGEFAGFGGELAVGDGFGSGPKGNVMLVDLAFPSDRCDDLPAYHKDSGVVCGTQVRLEKGDLSVAVEKGDEVSGNRGAGGKNDSYSPGTLKGLDRIGRREVAKGEHVSNGRRRGEEGNNGEAPSEKPG